MKRLLLTVAVLLTGAATALGQTCAGGLSCAIGWQQIPNTAYSQLCPTYPEIQGNDGCAAGNEVAWGTMVLDTNRNRAMSLAQGGHVDYSGNEVYAIDFTTNPPTPILLRDASHGANFSGSQTEPNPDGTPVSKHGYSSLIYLPTQDQFWDNGTGKAPGGGFSDTSWLFTPNQVPQGIFPWFMNTLNSPHPTSVSNGSEPQFAYDPVTDKIYEVENNVGNFWQYDPVTNAYTQLAFSTKTCVNDSNGNAAIDPLDRLYFCAGGGTFGSVSLNSPYTFTDLTTASGCSAISPAAGIGMDWDPIQQLMVFWILGANQNGVTTYNPKTNSCSFVSFTGGPTGDCGNNCKGTWHRWMYNAQLGGFVLFNGSTKNAWFLRMVDQATAANTDWTSRSTAPGVVAAHQLSTSADIGAAFGSGGYSDPPNNTFLVLDTAQHVSGTASVRFDIQPLGTANQSGALRYPFCMEPCTNTGFGQNTDFYIQFRQMADANYINNAWVDGTGAPTWWKQDIIHYAEFSGGFADTCGGVEITTINWRRRGYPGMYKDCGATNFQTPFGSGNFLNEQGSYSSVLGASHDAGYNCYYNPVSGSYGNTASGGNTNGNCFNYPPMVWWTMYYHIHIGTYGSANSLCEGWVMIPGQAPQKFISFTFTQATPPSHAGNTEFYNYISLQPYMTCRCGTPNICTNNISCPVLPTAHTWYAELIISTQPIAAPATVFLASAASPQNPSAPAATIFAMLLETLSSGPYDSPVPAATLLLALAALLSIIILVLYRRNRWTRTEK